MHSLPLSLRSIVLVAVVSLGVTYAYDRFASALPTSLKNGPRT